ncbi:SRPBCC family protein [Vibrio profundum]|uniref:SRPBCC family protein n=1 Tax=Vibrio profundum TaxID=2910247 RepID=UPI003D099C06
MGKCYNKIELNQPIDSVWQEVSDFHDMSWASGVVTSLQKVGAVDGHHVGAKRVINDAFHETLVEYNDDAHRFAYHIDDGPGPVSDSVVQDYVGVVQLTETDNGTLVEWSSSYHSAQDGEIADLCNPIYIALLSELKKNTTMH